MIRGIRFLSFCLALTILGTTGCGDDAVSPQYNKTAEANFDLAVEITTQTVFDLEGVNGIVVVTGSDTATRVTITGMRRVRSDTQADADSRLEDIRVVSTVTEDSILVETEQPNNTQGRSYEVDYTVTVPTALILDLDNVNGTITVDHTRAELDVTGVNGIITVSDAWAPLDVIVVNGNVVADVVLPPGSEASLTTVNGNIDLSVPTATSADLRAARGNGIVTTVGLTLSNVVDDGHVFTGRLGSGQGEINLQTGNGNITVRGL